MKILILLLFSSACYGQSFTDSTIIRQVVPATDSTPQTIVYIRYSTTYESAVANPLDSLLTINSNRRRALVSPLQLPISTAQAAVNDSKLSTATAAATYQPIGTYLSAASLASYSTTAQANALYQPIGNYLTAVPAQSFASLTGKPTTLAGYGITDGGGGGAPTFLNLANNFSSTSVTPAIVTGWSFAVTTGKTYRIQVIADYQTAATTTGGILGISLTTATGTVRGSARGTIVNTAAATELAIPIRATSGVGSTLTTTGVSGANSPHFIGMEIIFTCTNSGTFNIVWGSEVAASAAQLNANSTLLYQTLN